MNQFNLFRDSLVPFKSDDKWGFASYGTKELVIEPQFDDCFEFVEGFAAVQKTDKWGFIDIAGSRLNPKSYDSVRSFQGKLAAVCIDWKWGFIDSSLNLIIDCQYDYVSDFHGGMAVVGNCIAETAKKYGVINKSGELLLPIDYDSIEISGSHLLVSLNGKFGVINKYLEYIIQPSFDRGSYISGFFSFGIGKEKVILNSKGTELFRSNNFDSVRPFNSKFMVVGIDAKFGILTFSKDLIIPYEYSFISHCENGYAFLSRKGKFGFVNGNLEEIVPLKYDGAYFFSDGLASVRKGENWGAINSNDVPIIPFQYDNFLEFDRSLSIASNHNGTFYIDIEGREYR